MKCLFFILMNFFIFSCVLAASENENDDMLFVKMFVDRIYSDEQFSLADESFFFGTGGGVPGIALNLQLKNDAEIKSLIEKYGSFSLIGMLLRKNREQVFFPNKDHGSTYWGHLTPDGLKQIDDKLPTSVIFSYSYVVMVQFLRKDVMSLDNPLRMSIFALDRTDTGKRTINLSYSYFNGKRGLVVLGFADIPRYPDIALSPDSLASFKHFLKELF